MELLAAAGAVALAGVVALVVILRQNAKIRRLRADVAMLARRREEDKLRAVSLRHERAQWLEPLAAIEGQIRRRENLTDEEVRQVSVSREGLRRIADALRQGDMWLGPPFDLEWPDYIDRTPKVKALYMKKLTSGS